MAGPRAPGCRIPADQSRSCRHLVWRYREDREGEQARVQGGTQISFCQLWATHLGAGDLFLDIIKSLFPSRE